LILGIIVGPQGVLHCPRAGDRQQLGDVGLLFGKTLIYPRFQRGWIAAGYPGMKGVNGRLLGSHLDGASQ
jgi:hypothetical protein